MKGGEKKTDNTLTNHKANVLEVSKDSKKKGGRSLLGPWNKPLGPFLDCTKKAIACRPRLPISQSLRRTMLLFFLHKLRLILTVDHVIPSIADGPHGALIILFLIGSYLIVSLKLIRWGCGWWPTAGSIRIRFILSFAWYIGTTTGCCSIWLRAADVTVQRDNVSHKLEDGRGAQPSASNPLLRARFDGSGEVIFQGWNISSHQNFTYTTIYVDACKDKRDKLFTFKIFIISFYFIL